MSTMWYEEPGCSGMGTIGMSPVPYFFCGIFATLGLLRLGSTLYKTDNTVMRGLKSIDLILPVYIIPVWYVLTIGVVIGITNILGILTTEIYTSIIKWGLYRFVAEGLAVFLMHNGIGERALRNAVVCGAAWALVSSGLILYSYYYWGYKAYSIQAAIGLSVTLIFYLVLWLLPQRCLHRRPAMVYYAFWNVVILSLYIVVVSLLGNLDYSIASCSVEIMLSICWMLQPFIIVFAMRQDSLFWQGLYSNPQYSLLGVSCNICGPGTQKGSRSTLNDGLLGIWDFGRETMGMWADTITTLETKVVPIIPFGFIDNISSNFFTGGSARVYKATYREKEVAVKVLFCIELTRENVADFLAEATLLNSLQHDNVVQCKGVSIMPPAICLVTEFCTYGSLYAFLHHTDMYINEYNENSSVDSQAYRDRLGTGSTSLSRVSNWSSAASESTDAARDSVGSNASNTKLLEVEGETTGRGSLGTGSGSYNANNSKHARSLLENLPDIDEGSERSYELSAQSMSSVATGMTSSTVYTGFVDTTSPITTHKPNHGAARARSPGVKSDSTTESVDMALTLAQVVESSGKNNAKAGNAKKGPIPESHPCGEANEATKREASNNNSTGAPGSFGALSANVRRRHDSAEYFIEKDASSSLNLNSARRDFPEFEKVPSPSKSDNANAEAALTESLLADDYLARSRTQGTGATASILLAGGDGNGHAVLRKLSCVLTDENNMGIGPNCAYETLSRNLRELSKLAAHSAGSSSSAGHALSQNSTDQQRLLPSDDIEKGAGGIIYAAASPPSKSQSQLAMRPTSPTGSGSLSRHDQHTSDIAQICVPARVRLFSEKLDTSANMGTFLASRDLSTSSRLSSGSRGPGGAGNNAHYNNNPDLRPKRSVLVIPLSLRVRMAKDCCCGVAYLHSNGFMHCDVKSLNFLVDKDFNVKLSDLGEARAKAQASQELRPFPTNVNWSAPEVLSEQTIITTAADIWSLAMVIVEILTGEVPFDTPEWRSLQIGDFLQRLKDGQRPILPASISDQFPWIPQIISKAWKYEASDRCDCIEITEVFTEQINSNFAYQHK